MKKSYEIDMCNGPLLGKLLLFTLPLMLSGILQLLFNAADVVVLASPLYYWNFSGQLRTAFDRLFAVAECDPDYTNPAKQAALLMAAEGYGFEDCVTYYQHLLGHLGWEDRGMVLAGGNMQVGDIAGKRELELARQLGRSV